MTYLATALTALCLFSQVLADPTLSDIQKSFLSHSSDTPATVVLNGSALVDAKARLHELRTALDHLTTQADYWVDREPWSVTMKKVVPEGASLHDYTSQGPYWSLNPSTTENCTSHKCDPDSDQEYVWDCDGRRNPEVEIFTDHTYRAFMLNSSYVLTLAWYYTGKE